MVSELQIILISVPSCSGIDPHVVMKKIFTTKTCNFSHGF